MRYLRWTEEDGELESGLVELWTEVGDDGYVRREVGFDKEGQVVHKMPSSSHRHGTYGFFDLAPIDLTGATDDITPELFESRWQDGDLGALSGNS